jgi:hypothetical protein
MRRASAGFVERGSGAQVLHSQTFTHFDDEPQRRSATNRLTRDEAWRASYEGSWTTKQCQATCGPESKLGGQERAYRKASSRTSLQFHWTAVMEIGNQGAISSGRYHGALARRNDQ